MDLQNQKHNVYSQFGEDGIIAAIFDQIGTMNKWCLEVGAADGFFFSNTRRLIEQGWGAILIESNPAKFKKLKANSPGCLCFFVEIEPTGPNCLDAIMDSFRAPAELDLISIDIDGKDYQVWQNLNIYSARVVIVEHAYMGSDKVYGQANQYQIAELAEAKGYDVIATTECNTVCIKKTLKKTHFFKK